MTPVRAAAVALWTLAAAGAAQAGEARLTAGSTDDAKSLEITGEGPALIYEWATLDSACRAGPPPAFYVFTPPAHGKLTGEAGVVRLRSGYAARCAEKQAAGSRLFYSPDEGYRGRDEFVLRVVEADGSARTFKVALDVR